MTWSWLTFYGGGTVVNKGSVDKEVDRHRQPLHKQQASVLICDEVKVT
jgi:hypothetical protein